MTLAVALDTVPPEVQPLVAQAKHLLGCYLRYFANRPLLAFDRLHLRELVDRLDEIDRRSAAVPLLRDALAPHRKALHDELANVDAAYALPAEPATRVGFLAARANQQFLIYDRHFAGRPRVTRRPLLLKRLLANLTSIASEMREVAAVHDNRDNAANIPLVETLAARAREEDEEIAKEREPLPRSEMIRLLGGHVTGELFTYRQNKQRADVEAVAGTCDRVGELAYQMLEIAAESDDSVNLANLRLASRALDGLEADYERVRVSQVFVSVAQLVASAPSLRAQLTYAEASESRRQQAIAHLDAFLENPLVRQLVVDARAPAPKPR